MHLCSTGFVELTLGTARRLFLCYYLCGLIFLVEFGTIHFSLLQDFGMAISLRTPTLGSYTRAALVRALALQDYQDSRGFCSHLTFVCGHLPHWMICHPQVCVLTCFHVIWVDTPQVCLYQGLMIVSCSFSDPSRCDGTHRLLLFYVHLLAS